MRRFFILIVILMFSSGCGSESSKNTGDVNISDVYKDGVVVDIVETSVEHEIVNKTDSVFSEDSSIDAKEEADTSEPYELSKLIENGKYYLKIAEPQDAMNVFEEAVEKYPESIDAHFGLGLARTVYAIELTGMVFGLLKQGGGVVFVVDEPSQDEWLAEEFHQKFMDIYSLFDDAISEFKLAENGEINFSVESVPVYLNAKMFFNFKGTFTKGDLYLLLAYNSFYKAIFETIAGQNLKTGIMTLFLFAKNQFDKSNLKLGVLLKVIAMGLIMDKDFLTLHPDVGETLFFDARSTFSEAGYYFIKAVEFFKNNEPPVNSVSLSGIDEDSGYDFIKVNYLVTYDEDDFPHETPFVLYYSDLYLDKILKISNSLLDPSENPVDFKEDFIPVLSFVLSFLLKSNVLDVLGFSLPLDISDFKPDALKSILFVALSLQVKLDLYSFFENPVGMRVFFPKTNEETDMQKQDFILEWECPDEVSDNGYPDGWQSLLCSSKADLVDSEHFSSYPQYKIKKDNYATRFPYLIFEDPTFNKLLLVNPHDLDSSLEDNLVAPDLFLLNLAFTKGLENLTIFLKDPK